MIVYSGTKSSFRIDMVNGVIEKNLDSMFRLLGIPRESQAEYRAWTNSLPRIGMVVMDDRIDNDVQVAIEYQIPLTSKRVDFMVAGNDGKQDNVVIIELKQWEKCTATSRENVVQAFTGGALRDVVHPSQQAFAYAKLIENFNEDVRAYNIGLHPCAYLHNYTEEARKEILNPRYAQAVSDAPVFLQSDGYSLSEFISEHVSSKPKAGDIFQIIENGKLKPSKSLQDSVGKILDGNPEFMMIDEQQVAYATILKLVEKSANDSQKHTIIVQGGPGTGKSVIAIQLLAKLLNNGCSCAYVTKTSAPRTTFSKNLIRNQYGLTYLKGLFKSSGSFYDVAPDTFDCLLVDEAHRLNLKSGLYGNQGENQIRELINASRISVFFIDEEQTVTMKDIGTVDEIRKQAHALGSKIHCSDSLKLTSQFRCNGSDGYIAFIDDLLQIRQTANRDWFDLDYDIRVFEDPCLMRDELRKLNGGNKARMIAGYCYKWASKNDKSRIDIRLPHGFEAQWNFSTDEFATAPDSFEQVGCIHSTQGLEFDYVGIIIGTDLKYVDGRVVTDYMVRQKAGDASVRCQKTEENLARLDRITRNVYKTLLTRGQKGCFIYCEDKALSDYIRSRLAIVKANKPHLDHSQLV